MPKCDVSIELEEEGRSYRAGERIRGAVVVQVSDDVRCDGLTLDLLWSTHGKGNRASGEPSRLELFQGSWEAGSNRRYPFDFELPDGPVTYHGHYLNVGWFLRARADIPWAIDPKAEHEVSVERDPDRPPAPELQFQDPKLMPGWLQEEVKRRLGEAVSSPAPRGAKLVVAGCLLPFVAIFAFFAWQASQAILRVARGKADWTTIAPVFFFGAVTLVILFFVAWKVAKNRLAAKKIGDVTFEVVPTSLRAGEELRVRLFFVPEAEAELERVRIGLTAGERVVRGSGTNKKTYRHEVYASEVDLAGQRTLRAGLPVDLQSTIAVPPDAPPSFGASDNRLEWLVSARVEVARWPDWSDDEHLVVTP